VKQTSKRVKRNTSKFNKEDNVKPIKTSGTGKKKKKKNGDSMNEGLDEEETKHNESENKPSHPQSKKQEIEEEKNTISNSRPSSEGTSFEQKEDPEVNHQRKLKFKVAYITFYCNLYEKFIGLR